MERGCSGGFADPVEELAAVLEKHGIEITCHGPVRIEVRGMQERWLRGRVVTADQVRQSSLYPPSNR